MLRLAEHLEHLRRETALFAAVLAHAVADPELFDRPVPPCPGWTLRDLVQHLGSVHR